jgi:glycolate oxidase
MQATSIKADKNIEKSPNEKLIKPNLDEFFIRLKDILGNKFVSTDPCVLDTHAWQMNSETMVEQGRYMARYLAIVLPATTQEVSKIVKLCNQFGIQYKACATGQGPWNCPANEDVAIQIDLRRIDKILDIDEKNLFAVIEPYVTNNQLQTELMKVGLNCHIAGAGGQASQLASASSAWGHGPDGISHGFSGRNLLGFEWVTPEGEVVQAGSFDSSNSMFLGDGPGPSLRGVLRGFCGALGGMGVVTKIAVKIYPWEGPKKLNVEGYSPYYYVHIPKNHASGMVSLPHGDYATKADFGYDLGEAEIASHSLVNSPQLTIAALYPDNNEAAEGFKIPLLNKMQDNIYMVMQAKHKKEYLYKQNVLNKLVRKSKAGFLGSDTGLKGLEHKLRWVLRFTKDIGIKDMAKSIVGLSKFMLKELKIHGYAKILNGSPLDNTLWGKFIRMDANVRAVQAFGGSFVTSMGCIVPWDVTVRSSQITRDIRKRLIKKGHLQVDDDGICDHGGMYEGGAFTHIESVVMYSPDDESQIPITREFNAALDLAVIDQKLGGVPITSVGASGAHMFSPVTLDFDLFTQRIKRAFDPNNSAEGSWYSDPNFEPEKWEKDALNAVMEDPCPIAEPIMSEHAVKGATSKEIRWLAKRDYQSMPLTVN